MKRPLVALFSLLVVVVVALPAVLPRAADSFPISLYPMYAADRSEVFVLPTAVLQTPAGERQRLKIGEIANTDDPLIAASLLRDAIASNRADSLCEAIAARVGDAGTSGTVEVVEERHDLISYFEGSTTPLQVEVHATCRAS